MAIDLLRWERIVAGIQTTPSDPAAVADLFSVLKQLAGVTGSLNDPDVVPEVLLELLELPARVTEIRSPDVYLRLLVRRRQFIRVRRAATEQRVLRFLAAPHDETGAAERLEASVDVALLLERFRTRMTQGEVELLGLRFWESRDFRFVAENLGISYGSAAARVFRLLARLRLWLSEE